MNVSFTFDINPRVSWEMIPVNHGLAKCCKEQCWEEAYKIMELHPEWIWTDADDRGTSPACWATVHSNFEAITRMYSLIQANVDEDNRDEIMRIVFEQSYNKSVFSPFFNAVYRGHIECLEFLLRVCPSRTALLFQRESFSGKTPAHVATLGDQDEVLHFLLRNTPKGSSVLEEPDGYGFTAIHTAALHGKIKCLAFLAKHCYNWNIVVEKRSDGDTPLSLACRRGHIECAEFIMTHAPKGPKRLLEDESIHEIFHGVNSPTAKRIVEYFTERKIREIALIREMMILDNYQDFESNSLVSLMMGILKEETRLQQWRNLRI